MEESSAAQKRKALEERRARHLEWKRRFFTSRPPPMCMGQLHRRQPEAMGQFDVARLFKRARELVESGEMERIFTANNTKTEANHVAEVVEASPSEQRQAAWLEKMRAERERRCPLLDVHIRSDARRTVIMANLHAEVMEDDLRAFADQFGRVLSLRLVRHRATGKSRRYAFVEYGLVAEARKAASASRKKRLRGRLVAIEMEKGRCEEGFLPARLATAARIDPSVAPSRTSTDVKASPSLGEAAPTSSAFLNDEDFLNSI